MKLKTVAFLLSLSLIPLVAIAQTAPTTTQEEPEKLSDTVPTTALVEILTAPLDVTELPVNQPIELDMTLLNIPGGTNDLAQGVVAKGYARSVEVEDKTIGQVVLTGVAKGEKQEALNSAVFTAQFDLDETQLKPDQPVKIMGNGPELIEALKRLQEEPDTAEEAKPQEQVAQAESPETTSTGESGNNDASGYQSPDPIEKKADPVETVNITTEGCKIRVDVLQKTAFQQSKIQHLKDGVVQSEESCTDSEVSFKLDKSYGNCKGQDVIDLTATPPTATPQYQWYYVDQGGTNQTHGDCQPDEELKFEIVEKHGTCPIYLDYTTGAEKAVFQSKLVYLGQDNKEEEVRDCAASVEKSAVPMVLSPAYCPNLRHEYEPTNKSFRQSVWTYQSEGVTYQAGNCLDDGTEYAHVKTYKDDAGEYLCTPINNGSSVTLRYRMKITKDGLSQFVTECTPDTTNIAIKSTTQDCTDPSKWEHNLSTGQSFGQERFYFEHEGQQVPIGTCQNSTTTYTHEHETVDWEEHDDQLFAYPKTTVFITPSTGRYNIKTSEVLIGAQQMPYEFQKFDIAAGGTPTYEGCNKLQPYDSVKVWKRPNGTLFNETIGSADPASSNACETTGGQSSADWPLQSQSGVSHSYGCTYTNPDESLATIRSHTASRSCTYATSVTVTRDDGTEISNTPYTWSTSMSNSASVNSNQCGQTKIASDPGNCSATMDGTAVTAARGTYGF
ncbi:MAG: hypothetical protein HWE30_17800 [Methylocystaceae bacterium]|nr:hypothetical protein [Methylocystaceae bacterium]